MLTSCSGEGPPKMTPTVPSTGPAPNTPAPSGLAPIGLTATRVVAQGCLSGVVVRQVVLVEDGVAGAQVLRCPRHGLGPVTDLHDREARCSSARQQRPGVCAAHH